MGQIKTGQKFKIHSTGQTHNADEIGIFSPKKIKKDSLSAGEVGYLVAGIKNIKGAPVGDTILEASKMVSPTCLLYTSPSPRDATLSRMPSSA